MSVLHYEERQAKTILTPTGGFLNHYTHSLNPYEGCAFGADLGSGRGCPFCYVREMPIAQFAGRPWGSWLRAKVNAPELVDKDIARFVRKHPERRLRIFMSSSTDPYQGVELRLRLTRRILEALWRHLPTIELLVLQTRSPLVERDIDIIKSFGDRLWLSLTLETDSEEVRKQLTPTSASVARRLETLARCYQAGVRVQATISPLLPCDPERFAALLAPRCTRALVDTFQAGDGSGGRRSEKLGMYDRLKVLGYHQWIDEDCYKPLYAALVRALGETRVAFSQSGFSNL